MSLDLGAFPEHIAGLADLAILLFFFTVGVLIAALSGMLPGIGVLFGIVAWVFFLMAPERIRIGSLWLLAIGLGLGSAIMSGTGFGAAAGRDGGPGHAAEAGR